MSTIVTRAGKGSPLTNAELDANFNNLNADKYQSGATASFASVTLTTALSFANGGTGAATRQDAMDALAGSVTSGQYLRGNGTDVVMSAIQAADVPTLNQNTTGTASNVTGTVAIANGGTGATTAAGALISLGAYAASNPNGYTSNTGTVTSVATGTGLTGGTITTTGTISLANTSVTAGSYTASNITVDAQGRITAASNGAGASPGGSNTQVQYNSSGTFAGSANLTFNGTNLTCGGTVTANSDETLKTNWRGLPADFIEQLAKVKHGTYDRVDMELTQDGVSAQSLQPLLPNSVLAGEDGKLSVNYGGAALVSAIQLAKRLVALEALVAKLVD